MTIQQVLFDVQVWLTRFAISKTIGRPELKVLFYEAFQEEYPLAISLNPEFFMKTQTFSSTASITLPSDFYKAALILCTDADCTSGAASIVDHSEWDERQRNTRRMGTAADPLARIDPTVVTLSNARTGTLFYYRNYDESALSNEATDLGTVLPTPFHQQLVLKMMEKARVRQHQLAEVDPSVTQKALALAKMTNKQLKKSLNLMVLKDTEAERPTTFM